MSVFELECAQATSGVVCAHVDRFYPHVAGDPVIFYQLETSELPTEHSVNQSPSDTGDECHHEIDATNSALYKKFRQKRDWQHFQICDQGQPRPMTADDVASLTS